MNNYHVCLAGKDTGYASQDGKVYCVNCDTRLEVPKRTRHVFRSYEECAHVWAQQNLGYGKCYSLYFEGRSIYSYGSHFEIARFIAPDVVLFTTRSYSNTTSQHKWTVDRALSHKTVYRVPNFEDHTKNAQYFIEQITDKVNEIKKGRAALLDRVQTLKNRQDSAKRFLDKFGKHVAAQERKVLRALIRKVFFTAAELKTFAEKEARHEESQKRAQETRKRNEEIRWRERRIASYESSRIKDESEAFTLALAEDVEETWADEITKGARLGWLQGDERGYVDYDETLLRIKGVEIETSHGAYVPIARAVELFEAIKNKSEIQGFEIGHYTVSGIHDGKLVIGCHRIPMREVLRMAKVLGLENGPVLQMI